MKRLALWLIPAALLIGCASPNVPPTDGQPSGDQNPPASDPGPGTPNAQEDLATAADEAVKALREKDMERLAALVHPTKGVRFSPYGYVRTEADGDLVFTADQVRGLMEDKTVYQWGVYDGSGEPIELTFAEYYDKFVYDQDFANASKKAVDEIIGTGNTLINLDEAYPNGRFVEYHYPGTEEYDHMDWASLRLVFEEVDGLWYLVGIVHDQWTI